MDISKITETVYDIAFPVVTGLGYELVDVEFVEEEGEWYLRVIIDNEEGITVDDCSEVSRALDEKIDEIDFIENSYYFEVSSPGLDRLLKKDSDFEKYRGKKIKVELLEPLREKHIIEGILLGHTENNIFVSMKGNSVEIDKKKVSSVRLNDF